MRIINKTRNVVISDKALEAKNIKDKTFGLLKYSQPRAFLLRTRFGIHTFGMKYSIDVLVLDKKKRVVKIKENLKPGNIFFWNLKYLIVLELPAGVIAKTKTQSGDILFFE